MTEIITFTDRSDALYYLQRFAEVGMVEMCWGVGVFRDASGVIRPGEYAPQTYRVEEISGEGVYGIYVTRFYLKPRPHARGFFLTKSRFETLKNVYYMFEAEASQTSQ